MILKNALFMSFMCLSLFLQRDRAAWLKKDGKDPFVDSVAENLLDRLEVYLKNSIFYHLISFNCFDYCSSLQ